VALFSLRLKRATSQTTKREPPQAGKMVEEALGKLKEGRER